MTPTLTVLCLVAAVLFIGSLGGLSSQETARRGNIYGIVGMTIALVATAFHPAVQSYPLMIVALGVGGGIGPSPSLLALSRRSPQGPSSTTQASAGCTLRRVTAATRMAARRRVAA